MTIPGCLLNQTCRIRPYLREAMGESLYGDWETRRCRVETAPVIRTVPVSVGGRIEEIPVRARMFTEGGLIPVLSEVEICLLGQTQKMRVLQLSVMWGLTYSHLEAALG